MLIREYIADTRVLALLNDIEAALGYPVRHFNLPAGDVVSAVKIKKTQKWWIGIPKDIPIHKLDDYVWAHELLHIKLFLEGWPDPTCQQLPEPYRTAANYILSALDHVMIAPRLYQLGLFFPGNDLDIFQKEFVDKWPDSPLLHPVLVDELGLEFATMLLLFCDFLELFPVHDRVRTMAVKHSMIRQIPEILTAFEKARQILALFGEPLITSKEDYASKSQVVLKAIGLLQ